MFRPTKVTKNADSDKDKYSGYDLGFDVLSQFPFTNRIMGRNVNIFGANMGSSGHVRENKYILILGEGPTQELNTTTLTAKTKYCINFTQPNVAF